MHIPGIGAIYKSQTLEFRLPVHIGDTLCAWFEIVSVSKQSEEVIITSWIENQNGEIVIQGITIASLIRKLKE